MSLSLAVPFRAQAELTPAETTLVIEPGGSGTEVKTVTIPAVPPSADILIAIDTTGSMGASLAQAKSDATQIVNGVQASIPDARFAVVEFRDAGDTPHYALRQAMTADAALVQAAINAMTTGGGGDNPEAHNTVFHNSYASPPADLIGWRTGSKKIVVVISDAEPHGAGTAGLAGCADISTDGFNTATELAGMADSDRTLFMIRQASTATTSLECYQSIAEAAAPGGAGVNGGTNLGPQIIDLVEGSFTVAHEVTLELVSASVEGTEGWISFDPASHTDVATPATVQFDVNVDVPESASSGTYEFIIRGLADGVDLGTQTLTVAVGQDPADITVNTAADHDDGSCTVDDCTLREAILLANAHANGEGGPDEISFGIGGAAGGTIALGSALPAISDPVVIDGLTQDGASCTAPLADNLTIDLTGTTGNGLVLGTGSGGSTIRGLDISGFPGSGIRIESGNNDIDCNRLTGNGGDGIAVIGSVAGNTLDTNSTANNGGLGIDLGDDGVTPNDAGDADGGPNGLQNAPVIVRAVPPPPSADAGFVGRLNSTPSTQFTISFFANTACDPSGFGEGATPLGTATVTTNAQGDAEFATVTATVPSTAFITATATAPNGSTSEHSACVPASPANDAWPRALDISGPGSATGILDSAGQARWYKFSIAPNARVTVNLTGLPADYDLALFKDIAQAYTELTEPSDLIRLSAEFAPSAFSPSTFSPSVFSPSAFSPSAFSPSAFSPSVFSPSTFSPSVFSPSAFSPSAFSPSAFSPSAFSPSAFSPSTFSPSTFSPSVFSEDAFASAQVRSLIGYAATSGTADEIVIANTWNNTGHFYVRVSGRNGAFNPADSFNVSYSTTGVSCAGVGPIGSAPTNQPALTVNGTPLKTVILTDLARTPGTASEKTTLQTKLASFATRPDVAGVVVDVGSGRVASLNSQADGKKACPYAKNLVADAIKDVVDSYRANNPGLAYVVIIGGDDTIPFFRYPDQSLLGMESGYVPPVKNDSHSESSLRLDYVLGQDAYGAGTEISLRASTFPVPQLAVGRLVETAVEASGMIDAYTATNGVVAPQTSLVTGYDFLEDAANAVSDELASGTGRPVDELIAPNNISPTDPASWTATQLRTAFLGSRHDITFLAGHFSANSALAADFSTSLLTTELVSSGVNLTNAIIFSAGCHSGYNIIDNDAVPGLTVPLDWPQAMAQKRATLIAGTGYQYGDTDFIEYSERIYGSFAHELRVGSGPVSIGQALVRAKQEYLRETPDIRGIHEKALLEATVFGLPMLSVNMPSGRVPADPNPSVVPAPTTFTANPGLTLGLQRSDINLSFSGQLTQRTLPLTGLDGAPNVTATWYSGPDGITTNPAEPALPLDARNVGVSGTVLRGIGFRGGSYADSTVVPLTGAATTEIRGVHAPFTSPVFYPMRMWTPSYYDGLNGGSATQLLVTPAQHRSLGLGVNQSTLRLYSNLNLRLFYSSNVQTYGSVTPALAAAPSISGIAAEVNGGQVTFRAHVTGDPAAGIQEVWVTYTGHANQWTSVDLVQDPNDSTLWTKTISLAPMSGRQIEFIVQAVNGVGLVTLDDNFGVYHRIAGDPVERDDTTLTLASTNPATGVYGETRTFTATLTGATPAAGRPVIFSLGGVARVGTTNGSGVASVQLPLTAVPGAYTLTASYPGDADANPSAASAPFTVQKAATTLALVAGAPNVTLGADSGIVARLKDSNDAPLPERTIVFTLTGPSGTTQRTSITNFVGEARLGTLPPTVGSYTIQACFNGPLSGGPPSCATLVISDTTFRPSGATTSVNHVWPWSGFLSPVDNLPTLNVVKAGSTVPMKFSLGGNRGLGIFAPGWPKAVLTSCSQPDDTNPIAPDETTDTNSGLKYDPVSDQYHYNWKTPKNYKGKCYLFEMKLIDGSVRQAWFKFK
ncbi:MAG TPA: PxKF domain-containing protein [Candidatus Limnocylindria bacterium]